jgi:simple sugar transport system permease protein
VTPAEILTVAAPLLLAAMAELLSQRSGVLNIGIEGLMLVACLSAALAAPATGPWLAVLVAAGVTLVANLLFGIVVVRGADQVVAGTGVVLVGMGLTGAVFRHVQARGFSGALLPTLPWGPLEIGALAAVALLAWFLGSTRAGLVVRACGESPEAVATSGTSPVRVRLLVLAGAGALIGLGGAALVLRASGSFVEGMTAGRGFLALALVMLGRWRPWLVALGTLLIGAAIALQFHLQGLGLAGVPYHLLLALPYALTLLVLAVVPPDRLGGPAALARPYSAQR